jgi:N-acetylmuramoyl-L-alanine amidase
MRSSSRPSRVLFCIALVISVKSSGAPSAKQLSIYSDTASFSVPVDDQNGREYVNVLEVLHRLGRTDARSEQDRWRVSFNGITAEFRDGKSRFKLGKSDRDLSSPFLLENGLGYVTVDSLTTLLPVFLQTSVTLHHNSRRLFVGNPAVHFTAQTNGAALVLNFTSAVNPSISTEPGKLRMSFTREPLVAPGTERLSFDSKVIPSALYSEANGAAEIAVMGSGALFARFSNDGRTITISPAPQSVAQTALTPPATQGNSSPAPPQVTVSTAAPVLSIPVFAVIDPAHGGDERGEQLSPQLAEKDVTLAIATRLRQEFQSRGMNSLLLRSSDTTLSTDQRASAANRSRATVYIALHAVSLGSGVRVYTSLLPEGGDNRGPFLDWQTAQSTYRSFSQVAAESVAAEVSRRELKSRMLVAPLRPLNNLEMAAVAVEVAPRSTIADLNSPTYQQTIAESVAAGLAAARDRLKKQ